MLWWKEDRIVFDQGDSLMESCYISDQILSYPPLHLTALHYDQTLWILPSLEPSVPLASALSLESKVYSFINISRPSSVFYPLINIIHIVALLPSLIQISSHLSGPFLNSILSSTIPKIGKEASSKSSFLDKIIKSRPVSDIRQSQSCFNFQFTIIHDSLPG